MMYSCTVILLSLEILLFEMCNFGEKCGTGTMELCTIVWFSSWLYFWSLCIKTAVNPARHLLHAIKHNTGVWLKSQEHLLRHLLQLELGFLFEISLTQIWGRVTAAMLKLIRPLRHLRIQLSSVLILNYKLPLVSVIVPVISNKLLHAYQFKHNEVLNIGC